jgi:hypothetical protein
MHKKKVALLTYELEELQKKVDEGQALSVPPLRIKFGWGGRPVDLVLVDEFQDMGESYVSTSLPLLQWSIARVQDFTALELVMLKKILEGLGFLSHAEVAAMQK